jgi:FKBP-type peptidyl-prolyl cis-trans isomerase FkpA
MILNCLKSDDDTNLNPLISIFNSLILTTFLNMKRILFLISAMALMVGFIACNKGYKQTESGLNYMFHTSNKGPKPSVDNIVKIDFAYRYPADSVFFESKSFGQASFIKIEPSGYPGDIYEALRMMAKGDSASFKFNANSFFTITAGSPFVPDFINPDDSIFVDIMMHDFFDQAGYEAYMEREREEAMKGREERAKNESSELEKYLQANNINTQPEESGLVIVVTEQGKGPKPTSGQKVTAHYTGTMLDGTKFDSSVDRNQPFTFTLGMGQVIRGWDEGFSKLNVGSKARLIIPSHLAYGDSDRGPVIKAYSTLVFDVELISAE